MKPEIRAAPPKIYNISEKTMLVLVAFHQPPQSTATTLGRRIVQLAKLSIGNSIGRSNS